MTWSDKSRFALRVLILVLITGASCVVLNFIIKGN